MKFIIVSATTDNRTTTKLISEDELKLAEWPEEFFIDDVDETSIQGTIEIHGDTHMLGTVYVEEDAYRIG